MKTAIILGSNSDIAQGLRPLLDADGWRVDGWRRGEQIWTPQWDLIIVALGRVAPVGWWHEQDGDDWESTMESNLFLPIRLLRALWPYRKPDAAVCWLAGSNPNMIMDGYSAYNVSKMAALKAVEQLDHESPNCKIFALGPGIVLTKIHEQSKGWFNPKLRAAREAGKSTPIARIYECLKWCLEQPKEVIGGRNICVSDPWDKQPEDFGYLGLRHNLSRHPNRYKLRRVEQ